MGSTIESFLLKSTVEEEISHGGIAQNKAKYHDDTSQLNRHRCNDKRILPDTDDEGEIQDKMETGKLQVASGGNVSTENINGRRESNTEGGKSGCSTVAPPSRYGTDEKDGSLEIHQGDQIFPAKTSNDDASVGLHEITPKMEVAENANVLNVEADETGQGPLESIAVADEMPMGGDAMASRREKTSNPKIDRTDEERNTPLYNAASNGNLKGVEDLISQGANLNEQSNRGRCPLHVAAERGHGNIVNLLISRGAEVQVECDIGQTPIHKAAANGHTGIVESLIAHGSRIDSEDQTEWTPFNAAVQHGHLETLKFLLSKGANQNEHNGRTPLYAAAEFGQLKILQFLISKGADMKSENPSGRIPLHGAAINGDMEIIKYLIQAGSDVNKGSHKGFTPLDAAIKYGHLEAVKYLIDEGSKLKRYDGMTPLYAAAKFGHLDIVKFFISEGADDNEENDSGEIPLHGAAFSSKMEVIEYLIQQGSDVNKADSNGRTPFNAAVQYGHLDAVKYLIDKGAEQNTFNGINPLYASAQFGHLDIVKFFISRGANVNEENDEGMIPLHGAASRGHISVMEYLLQQGSDVINGRAKDWAPIHAAIAYDQCEAVEYLLNYEVENSRCHTKKLLHTGAKFGHLDMMKFLTFKGADINETDEYGAIPLHYASYGGHQKVMEYLIQLGSDVNKADLGGWTPFDAAVEYGHLEAVKYLLKEKAIQNKYDGMPPLHTAAQFGHLDIMEFLISKGADINETDEDGMIPLHHAAYGCHLKVMEYLIELGSDVNKADLEGWTPLDAAVQCGHLEAVKHLLENEATQNKYDGMTPLHAAATFGHLDLVDFFISEGAIVNEADVEGMIPLQYAAARGHIEVIEYLIQHRSDINKRDKRGRMPHEGAIENGQLKEMQSRTAQQVILPNNIVNGKDDILANTEKKRCNEMSSKVLFEKTHDSEKDGSEERNSFLSAKLKSPHQREESPVQLWLESEKKDRAEKRNTVTNITNNLTTSKYRTWKYEASNPPFLQEMKSNHGTGHPSEEPQSEPLPLTDETRETREPLSSWTLMNAGSNQLMRGTSANLISNLKNLPCLPNINTNLDRNILSPSASAGTIKCWYPSVLAATRCFLTTILALAVILAGSPVLVSGSEITQRIILQAGKPGVVPFQIPRAPNTTSKHVPYYTIRLKSQHRPFCVNGAYDVMGLQSPTQLSRFSTSVSTCSNSFPCINLEIDNVNDKDEGIYIFTAVEYAIDHVWRETLEKEVMVEIPHGPAKCFIALSTDTPHPYEVHCRAYSGSMKTTLSCYQNNEKLVKKGISTDSVHVTRGVFFLPQHRLFSCCSHVITSEVSAVTCNDFQWPRGKISTTQSTNDIPTLVIKNITMSSNHGSTEDTPIHHLESSEGSGATVFHSVLPLVYLLIIMTKIIQ